MNKVETIHHDVKNYYGEVLQGSEDLKTSACCPIDAMPEFLKPYLANIHDEVIARFYGCGSPIPFALEGKTVLDLGCGTGRDCYVAAQLVGDDGHVIGVDMTEAQLQVAQQTLPWHQQQLNLKNRIDFRHGYIEDLDSVNIADNSIDVVISNCVINLSANKENVFREIFRVLKPGGELYFSDVFADRRLEQHLKEDPVMLGECLGGALYSEDFRRMLAKLGVADIRSTAKSRITLDDSELAEKAGHIGFYSVTVRAFKLPLEDRCEDYGQVATYNGGIKHSPNRFMLDDHHLFGKHRPMLVCGNTADMLQKTRYSEYFTVTERTQHFGLFDCAPEDAADGSAVPCC